MGGARSAAGPRGGDFVLGVGVVDSRGRTGSLIPPAEGGPKRCGVLSRDGWGERARMEFGRGDDRPEADCEVIAEEIPDSLGGDGRLYA